MQEIIFGLFAPVMATAYGIVFLILWLRSREKLYILGLAIVDALVMLGSLIEFFVPDSYTLPGLLFSGPAYHLSSAALAWALCARFGQKAPVNVFLVTLVATFGLAVFASIHDRFDILLLVLNVGFMLHIAVALSVISFAPVRKAIDRAIVAIFTVYTILGFIRPVITITLDPGLSPATIMGSTYLSTMLLATAVNIALLSTLLIIAIMLEQSQEREKQVTADALTGLRTRRAFEKAAVELLDKAVREDKPVTMIVADIDHFKQVNDIWGHQAGDKAISSFGRLLDRSVRSHDLCGRIGGEEFCLIIWNCEIEPAEKLAERIRIAFARMAHERINEDVRLTASFGVATSRTAEGFGKLFARADAALYRAKESGRNQVVSDLRKSPRPELEDRAPDSQTPAKSKPNIRAA